MATVAAHLRGPLGLPVTSVELFNEPSGGWWKAAGTQEGCDFAHATQARVLASLPGAMARVGGLDGVRVAASDESFVDQVGGSGWSGLERCMASSTLLLLAMHWQATATWAAFDDATRSIVDQVCAACLPSLGSILKLAQRFDHAAACVATAPLLGQRPRIPRRRRQPRCALRRSRARERQGPPRVRVWRRGRLGWRPRRIAHRGLGVAAPALVVLLAGAWLPWAVVGLLAQATTSVPRVVICCD